MASPRNRRILLASGVGLAQRVVQMLTTLVTLPVVLHALGVAGFGVWGAATSMVWLSGLLDFGLGNALVTLLPRRLAADGQARAQVAAALFGGGALALLVLGGLAVFCAATARPPGPAFLLAGAALALNIPLGIAGSLWLGLQRAHVFFAWQIGQSVLTLALIILAGRLGAGVTMMVGIVYAAMLATDAGSLAHALYRYPQLRPRLALPWAGLREIIPAGGMMFGISVAASCAYAFDNLLALDWLGQDASAKMTIALRVCTTAAAMLAAIAVPFWPGYADAIAAGDVRWQRRALRQGTLATAALALAGAAVIVVFGAPVLRWWLHENLQISAPLLWVMAAWVVLMTLPQMPAMLLHAALRLRPQLIILSTVAVLGFALKFFAARAFGVAGLLAVAPLLWAAVVSPAYFLLARRWVEPQAFTRARPGS
jgi:O-antigen/teichoic acid export membrane protein